ncbi:hydrogenase maturation protease [Fervidicella metallireducens AeB]|uniref:Hydrogenase maturation protease n=2 Tax=Fervidicella TaxID=1403538 RepID=A0A017RWS6_9CLOT|nr:hydrogenase maturation protease [Fervidicella metallireducens AeB]
MCDDGVAVRVCENIKDSLAKNNIEVIIGETDFEYCLSNIEDGDFIFIIDAINSGKEVGEITIFPLKSKLYPGLSQHGCSLVDLVLLYNNSINGFVIGIEVKEIKFDFNLSDEINKKLGEIEKQVEKIITKKVFLK